MKCTGRFRGYLIARRRYRLIQECGSKTSGAVACGSRSFGNRRLRRVIQQRPEIGHRARGGNHEAGLTTRRLSFQNGAGLDVRRCGFASVAPPITHVILSVVGVGAVIETLSAVLYEIRLIRVEHRAWLADQILLATSKQASDRCIDHYHAAFRAADDDGFGRILEQPGSGRLALQQVYGQGQLVVDLAHTALVMAIMTLPDQSIEITV